MLKIKFVLLLMLLFFIVDSKKLRNKLKNKAYCIGKGGKCETRDDCCRPYFCKEFCYKTICFAKCTL